MGRERRQARRHFAKTEVTFRGLPVEIRDISTSGIGFVTDSPVPAGEEHFVGIVYPEEPEAFKGVTVRARLSVRYCRPGAMGKNYIVGGQFEALSPDNVRALAELCRFLGDLNHQWGLDWDSLPGPAKGPAE